MKAKLVHVKRLLEYLFQALDDPKVSKADIKRIVIEWAIRWCE